MSIHIISSVDPSVLGQSAFFASYMAAPGRGVAEFLPGVHGGEEYWRSIIERAHRVHAAQDGKLRSELMSTLKDYNRRLGVGEEILGKLGDHKTGPFFVVTGQQPGILGGALMVAYKIATAIVLARYLERRFSIPCIPLYWCGSDDDDFKEIGTFEAVSPGLAPVSVSLPADAVGSASPVGNIAAEWTETTWKGVYPVLAEYPFAGRIDELVTAAAAHAADHGEATAALLAALFKSAIAVVDGRDESVKRLARGLYQGYFEREDQIKSTVAERGCAMAQAGYHAQIEPGPDSGIFIMKGGVRRRVPRASRRILDEAIRNQIEVCSPGVILRTLVQDSVFAPLAVILGPAEIAYRAQIAGLYEQFDIPLPAAVPRLSATWVPSAVAEELSRLELSCEVFLKEPASLVRLLSDEAVPPKAREAGRAIAERIAVDMETHLDEIARILPAAIFKRYRSKVIEGERRLRRALDQLGEAGRQAALERTDWLAHVEALIRPRGRPQERVLSLLLPFLAGGEDVVMDIERLGSVFIDDLLDGKPAHFVYSLRS